MVHPRGMSSSLPPQLSALLSYPLPEPIKAAAGLAAMAIDEAKNFPQRLVSLPVAAAGQAMQASMRIQQRYAELVSKGDDVLASLRGAEEAPSWATFDEDGSGAAGPVAVAQSEEDSLAARGVGPGSAFDRHPAPDDPAPPRRRARATKAATPASSVTTGVPPVEGYDDLTLPQLRARVKGYTQKQLEELLRHEIDTTDRAPYVAMLTKRLDAVRRD